MNMENFKKEIGKFLDKHPYNKKVLENGIIQNILNEKKQLGDQEYSLKNIIGFISIANINDFDMTALEKSMHIFDKLENVLLLSSPETEKKAKELKEQLKAKNINNVYTETIGIDEYDDIYDSLKKYLDKYKFQREETIIDSTQGSRMLGSVFYRFAVEQQIKLISWQATQESSTRIRIPGTDKFNFIKAPQLKNYKLYLNANNLIKKYRFKEASMLYSQINNEEMANVLNIMSDIFSYDSLDNYDLWLKTINLYIDKLAKIKDKKLKEKLNKYRWLFCQFLKTDKFRIEENLEAFEGINWNNLTEYEFTKISDRRYLSHKVKKIIHSIFYIDFLRVYYSKVFEQILSNSNKEISKYIYNEDLCEVLKENLEAIEKYVDTLSLTEQEEEVLGYVFNEFEKGSRIYDLTDFVHDLSKYKMTIKEGIIKSPILKDIDLGTKYSKREKNKNSRVIYRLFEKNSYILEGKEILNSLYDTDNEMEHKNTVKYIGDLKKALIKLNEHILKNYNYENFFLFQDTQDKKYKRISINPKHLNK